MLATSFYKNSMDPNKSLTFYCLFLIFQFAFLSLFIFHFFHSYFIPIFFNKKLRLLLLNPTQTCLRLKKTYCCCYPVEHVLSHIPPRPTHDVSSTSPLHGSTGRHRRSNWPPSSAPTRSRSRATPGPGEPPSPSSSSHCLPQASSPLSSALFCSAAQGSSSLFPRSLFRLLAVR
jgi:hypothetical protein